MASFVLVHGAWSGGWCYHKVAARLRSRGHLVFTPTLTGQGERAHLTAGTINLSLHIEDVLAVFKYEQLRDVVLAGHSYGGMVVTGVADRIARARRGARLSRRLSAGGRPVAVRHQHPGQLATLHRPGRGKRRAQRSGAVGRFLQRQCRGRRARRCAGHPLPARLLHREDQAQRRPQDDPQTRLRARHRAAARKPVQAVL